jgi:hypothetical protein
LPWPRIGFIPTITKGLILGLIWPGERRWKPRDIRNIKILNETMAYYNYKSRICQDNSGTFPSEVNLLCKFLGQKDG